MDKTITLRTKFIGAFILGSLLGASAVVWNLSNFRWAATAFQVATKENLPALASIAELDRAMERARVQERSLMLVRQTSDDAVKARKEHGQLLAVSKTAWARYKGLPSGEDEKALQPEFESAYADWEKASLEAVRLLAQESTDARKDAIEISMSDGRTQVREGARGARQARDPPAEERRDVRGADPRDVHEDDGHDGRRDPRARRVRRRGGSRLRAHDRGVPRRRRGAGAAGGGRRPRGADRGARRGTSSETWARP